jgi:hypothetical protein
MTDRTIPAALLSDITDLLTEVEEYMDRMADAELVDGRYVSNREMRLYVTAADLLDRLGIPSVKRVA